MLNINDFPDEILEFIMGHLPPYRDLESCKLVCKRWHQIVHSVKRHASISFHKSLAEYKLLWKPFIQNNENSSRSNPGGNVPPQRFSHAYAMNEDSMYIFGGGSSTSTTFNDLWRFDLSKRQWLRLLAMGTIPSPKACATLMYYKEKLILFGGWRHPPSYPPYQPWRLFDELHVYDLKENCWTIPTPLEGPTPPPMTGHSATIHRNEMIVFGGHQHTLVEMASSNQVWCLNLETFIWREAQIGTLKPPPRYGQFQIHMDDTHLLILGGYGGPNNMFNDAWLLDMTNNVWTWKMVTVNNKKWAASHMWCNPACKVGSKLVVLGPTKQTIDFLMIRHRSSSNLPRQPVRNDLMNDLARNVPRNNIRQPNPPPPSPPPAESRHQVMEQANRRLQEQRWNQNLANGDNQQNNKNFIDDNDVRRQRNLLLRSREKNQYLPQRFGEQFEGRLGMAAFSVDEPNHGQLKRLENLGRLEDKFVRRPAEAEAIPDPSPPSPKRIKRNCIGVFLADISQILATEPILEWIEYKNFGMMAGAPERLICSSLVCGNGELIMFGGLRKESRLNEAEMEVSNAVHFLTYPRDVI